MEHKASPPLPNLTQFLGSYKELCSIIDIAEENGSKLFVVDFFAEWCGPCRRLISLLPEIAENNPDVFFIKVNTDMCRSLASKFGVRSLPTIKFLTKQNGELVEVKTVIGCRPREIEESCKSIVKVTPSVKTESLSEAEVISCKFNY